jgi:hypothetical protein
VQNPARSLAQPRTAKPLSSGDFPSWLECPTRVCGLYTPGPSGDARQRFPDLLEIAGRRLNVVVMIQLGESLSTPRLCYLISTWIHHLGHRRHHLV